MNFNNIDTLLREVKNTRDDYAILNALTSLRLEDFILKFSVSLKVINLSLGFALT